MKSTEYVTDTHASFKEFIERISVNPAVMDIHTANIATFTEVLKQSGVIHDDISRQCAKIMLYIILFSEDAEHFAKRVCEAYQLSKKLHGEMATDPLHCDK